jgi:chromosome segregation ATPase
MDPKPQTSSTPPTSPTAKFGYKKQDSNSPQIAAKPIPALGARQLREMINELQIERTRLQKQLEQLNKFASEIQSMKEESKVLQSKIDAQSVELDIATKAKANLEERNTELQRQVREKDVANSKLVADVSLIKVQLEQALKSVEQRQHEQRQQNTQNEGLQKQLQEAQKLAEARNTIINELNGEIPKLSDELKVRQDEVQQLKNQNSALSQMLEVASRTPVVAASQTSAIPQEPALAGVVVSIEVQRNVDNTLRRESGEQEQQASRS